MHVALHINYVRSLNTYSLYFILTYLLWQFNYFFYQLFKTQTILYHFMVSIGFSSCKTLNQS